ncbi:MAG: VanZ family protein [SAR324 cluster bacterium]|uniref:VanZ family protein n=1 Tax=SAR324 cluster bacterium TaxID=2024889 RepID=A0A7X9FP54_9DELT|nr:VanZ family protein [SAR324 cluster bacterium]
MRNLCQKLEWAYVLIWILFILGSIPFGRFLQRQVETNLGRNAFIVFISACLCSAVLYASYYIYRESTTLKISLLRFVWLAGISVVFGFWLFNLKDTPEVALHFLEYGILAALVYRAILRSTPSPWSYIISLLICSIVGTFDQIIKWLTPQRVFDYYDIFINSGSAFLVLLAIAFVICPNSNNNLFERRHLSLFKNCASSQILLLALCLSNTPYIMEQYLSYFPSLRYVEKKENLMAEYGFKHKDPEIGIFYSRFTIKQLKDLDLARGESAAHILAMYPGNETYGQFIQKYSPFTDPFLHEFRVHLFRRDEYLRKISLNGVRPNNCSVVWHENLILEKYFGNTLRFSNNVLKDKDRELVKTCSGTKEVYISPVSSDLITSFSPLTLWLFALALLILLFFI